MTIQQIEWLFGVHFASRFEWWMRGQTVGIAHDGSAYYYKHDLKRYINGLIDNNGVEPEVLD